MKSKYFLIALLIHGLVLVAFWVASGSALSGGYGKVPSGKLDLNKATQRKLLR
jgi:hypothetical protein